MFGLFGTPQKLASAMREADEFLTEHLASDTGADVQAGIGYTAGASRNNYFDGDKWLGSFGRTQEILKDYWTLRKRSSQLYETQPVAAGIIRRIVTAVIVDGMSLEAAPVHSMLGMQPETAEAWAEDVEQRWIIWANTPELCDHRGESSFGAIQQEILTEALISGDCLQITQASGPSGGTRVKYIPGDAISTPFLSKPEAGNRIQEGVEVDSNGRHIAYWVQQSDGTHERMPAYGRNGRRVARLIYGTAKRSRETRGTPILALLLQRLNDLDTFTEATLRKALVNSFLSMWVEKTEDGPGTRQFSGTAQRVSTVQQSSSDDSPRKFRHAEMVPGTVIEELGKGEKIHPHAAQGVVDKYGEFQAAIEATCAWALEIPPEILRLSFSSNYSASKAAENNWEVYLVKQRSLLAEQLCQPVYVDWLTHQVLTGEIQAPGFLDAWRDSRSGKSHMLFGAWVSADWTGFVKPSVDPVKTVRALTDAINEGLMTRRRAARQFSGTKFSDNIKTLSVENQLLADARGPLSPPSSATVEGQGDADESEDE